MKSKKKISLEPEDENLPALLSDPESDRILLELPENLSHTAPLNEAKQADVMWMNALLNSMAAGLGKCTTIASLCKISSEARALIAERRKLMCLDYGPPNKSSGPKDFEPVD